MIDVIFEGIDLSNEDVKLAVKAKEVRIWDNWTHRQLPLVFEEIIAIETDNKLYIFRNRPDGEKVITTFWSRRIDRCEFTDPVGLVEEASRSQKQCDLSEISEYFFKGLSAGMNGEDINDADI